MNPLKFSGFSQGYFLYRFFPAKALQVLIVIEVHAEWRGKLGNAIPKQTFVTGI